MLRRGRPQDLVEANEMMKKMAGYYHNDKPDYGMKEVELLDQVE